LATPVETAFGANPVQHDRVAAVAAMHDSGGVKLHVDRAAPSCPRFGRPEFRYSHDRTSSFFRYRHDSRMLKLYKNRENVKI